ncbi:hypothetical protein WI604_08750 [Bradyrhizobium symbiodeficiens]|uniref:hypothetical protein n=1 Tax=Bradyrhizobium symbiodeficiens TaxID=1404367 RepID=UPI0030D29F0D
MTETLGCPARGRKPLQGRSPKPDGATARRGTKASPVSCRRSSMGKLLISVDVSLAIIIAFAVYVITL